MPFPRVPHVRGLLLAAGSGRRMGGPKALVRTGPDRPTLVEHAVTSLLDGGCDGVTVVVGAAGPEVTAIVAALGRDVDVVPCIDHLEGMGASVRSGLTSVTTANREGRDPVDAVLVSLVDLPDVGLEVVDRLLQTSAPAAVDTARATDTTDSPARGAAVDATPDPTAAQSEAGRPASGWRSVLARTAYEGTPGHPVVIGRDHWAAVAEAAVGDRGARDHFRTNEHVLVECGDLATGVDVDTPDELASRG
jgi:CTP:molybdopterin cytidylyltransferase MocA